MQRSWLKFQDSEKKVSLNLESKKPRASTCSGFLFLKHSKLKTVIDKELDHEISVKMGGDCNLGNLNYIDKEDNRRKGAN